MDTLKKTGRRKFLFTSIFLSILIVVLFFISLNMGVVRIAPLDVIKTLLGMGTERDRLILVDFRLPGMVLALLIGAGLAVSGAILQGVSKNELADPGILGINTGAGFAVILFIFFFQGSMANLSTSGVFIMPLFALFGALGAALIIYVLAWKKGLDPVRLILVGIGVNAGFGAAIIIFQLKMNPQDFMQAAVWLSGDIWGANWKFVWALAPWILLLIIYAVYKSHALNILNLGDQLAIGLGTKVEHERRILLVVAVALAGLIVAAGGGIAFLGLVAPHIARRMVGPKHQLLIPITSLLGALLLLLADTIGKNILAPSEIPVGVVVSILSAPYFIYLLMKIK
ncbi:iron ABC transporter permease [Bacillus canaveralius]|uniref:Iron ABC transporter permease n=1 Tax=Bacillus canaveralius TaxID=1403243 RepID=A0A2N5GS03_9BACI|nr:iron ABC transporter permease [Bacillus canaveralius]PLR86339.1 iron ABC transporter permease [Bacillus canaveralius]PLR98572.1 iron ABC transporter permease [Bacillus canaveralius]